MKLRELALSPLTTCPATASLSYAAWNLWVRDCKVLVVLDSGKAVGVVTERELPLEVPAMAGGCPDVTVGGVMSGEFACCRGEEEVETAIDLMTREGIVRVPVLDPVGRPLGMLSINDALLRKAAVAKPGRPRKPAAIAIAPG